MVSQETGIPGLFSSDLHNQSGTSSAPGLFSTSATGVNSSESTSGGGDLFIHLRGSALVVELNNEKENLDSSFVHSKRLIDEEIARLQRGGAEPAASDPNSKLSEKVYIPYETQRQFNLVGRLLGPKGLTLKRMQAETQTKMSIMGRGCMRDKKKEEELRSSDDPTHQHLKDDLHVLVQSEPPYSSSKLAAGVAEVKKMLIPLEPGQPDMIAAKYLEAGIDGFPSPSLPPPSMEPSRNRGPGGRGGSRGGLSPAGRGGGRGGMRGGRGGGRAPSRGGGGGGGRRGGGGGAGGRGRGGSGRGPPQGGYAGREGAGRMMPRGQEMGGYGGADDMKSHMDYESNHGFHTERSWRDEPPYDRRGGGGRSPRDLGDRPGMGRGDSYSSMDSDPYYSNFSDGPQSRDYRHGLGSAGASDWKSPRPGKKDYRHHPYQSPGGYY